VDRLRPFLKFVGKGDEKVLAVFATSPANADRAVRYLRHEVPQVPVWLFASVAPLQDTAALCQRVLVKADSMALLVAAEKALWPRWVALSVASWTGEPLRWPVKLAPFLVSPHRALILNRHGDFLPGTVRHIALYSRRLVRDALHSGWNRAQDLGRGSRLWLFAAVAQRFAPLSRHSFHRHHGSQPLEIAGPPGCGTEIVVFHYAHRQWNWTQLDALIRHSRARWLLFLEDSAAADAAALTSLFADSRTFAVSLQPAYRGWRPVLFPVAPFRPLQPGEAAQVAGPLSSAILVDRAKLAALGLPKTVVPGTAWMLLFWKAAAVGWRSYSVGVGRELGEFPEWPYEDAEFVHRVLSDPTLCALGPREPALGRGAIAFDPARNRSAAREDRLRVLVVSPYLPYPLSHGGAVRIYNLCRSLAGRVDFTLACFRETDDFVEYEKLHEVFREVYVVDRDEPGSKDPALPSQVREHQSSSMRALIARICRERHIDILQVEYTHLAHFRDAAPEVPAILVEHDLTFTLYRQFAEHQRTRAAEDEYRRWHDFETGWLGRYDAVWTMSADDRTCAIAAGSAEARTFPVANGVDIRRFTPQTAPAEAPEVLYIGSFRHRPNILGFERLAEEIMPAVWQRCPTARLCVVAGPGPERYWTPPAGLDPRIRIHGFVEDVRPLYARAAVVAVPLLVSAGTNIKVMEAMACGKPVVSTPVGCHGLGLEAGRDVLVSADPAGFAMAICELLADPARAAAIGRAARATVEARFSWDAIADQAYASYRALTEAPRPRP
jgi:glycosyltransferase involved in cell wall biosynthesis